MLFYKKNIWYLMVFIFPILVDGFDLIFFDKINDYFLALLNKPSIFSLAVILLLYLFFIFSTFMLNLLDSESISYHKNNPKGWSKIGMLLLYPSLGFGLILIILVIHLIGLTSDKSLFSESNQQLILWLLIILFFIHIFIVFLPVKPRFQIEKPAYFLIFFPIVIISMLLINLSVAAWIYLFSPLPGKSLDPMRSGKWIEFLATIPFFMMFFSSPRFLFMSREFTWPSLVSALLLIAYFIWQSLNYAAII